MHQGTPLVIGGKLVIFHRSTEDQIKWYDPSEDKLQSARPDSWGCKPTTLAGDSFDATGLITLDWRQILGPELKLNKKDFSATMVHNPDIRCRMLSLVSIPPNEWKNYDPNHPKSLQGLAPQRCYLSHRSECSVDSEDGSVEVEWREQDGDDPYIQVTTRARRPMTDDDYILYDPELKHQPWEKNQIPLIEKALEMYEAWKIKMTEEAKISREGETTTDEQLKFIKEFDEAMEDGAATASEVINDILTKRCRHHNWGDKRRAKLTDLITMTLMRHGRLTIAAAPAKVEAKKGAK